MKEFKIGDLVQTTFESWKLRLGIGILVHKRPPNTKGGEWYYAIYWSNGKWISHTKQTIVVIHESR